MQQLLKRARHWKHLSHHYEPPAATPAPGSRSGREAAVEVAQSGHEFELAFPAAGLTVNTSAAGSEFQNIRLRDVELKFGVPSVMVDVARPRIRSEAAQSPSRKLQ